MRFSKGRVARLGDLGTRLNNAKLASFRPLQLVFLFLVARPHQFRSNGEITFNWVNLNQRCYKWFITPVINQSVCSIALKFSSYTLVLRTNLNNTLYIVSESAHRPPYMSYMGGWVVGVNTLYRVFCFVMLFIIGGKELMQSSVVAVTSCIAKFVYVAFRLHTWPILHSPINIIYTYTDTDL